MSRRRAAFIERNSEAVPDWRSLRKITAD